MATMSIGLSATIHAEIAYKTDTVLPNSPLILDPISKSYSEFGELVECRLSIVDASGVTSPTILNNGRNSRFTAGGYGTCTVELFIKDDKGNYDTDRLIIKVG